MRTYTLKIALAVLLLSLALAACGERPEGGRWPNLTGSIEIDGSSTVFPITEAIAEEFFYEAPKARVTVGVSGTGGGLERFCNGEIAIANASRPIKKSEQEVCAAAGIEYVELPIAYDGLVVSVNPSNEWVDCITAEELTMIWQPSAQGRITNWQQVRPEFPNQALHLYGPGTDSGTFDYFTEALMGESGASRGDYTASEDDNVLVQGISGDDGALGYFGYGYYVANRSLLKALAIDDGEGCVEPTPESIGSGRYSPLSRPIFIYVRKAALDRPEVAAFVQFYLETAGELAEQVGYVSLPRRVYQLVQERVDQQVTGSVFDEAEIGASVEDILTREGK